MFIVTDIRLHYLKVDLFHMGSVTTFPFVAKNQSTPS
jgi:hypothetical protein